MSGETGSLNAELADRNRSAMFVADALTKRKRGMDSAPAEVGDIASAACRSWSTSTRKVTDSSGTPVFFAATRNPCSTSGTRIAAATLLQSRAATSSAALRMIDCATTSASIPPSSSSPCADVPVELFSHAVSFSESEAESLGFRELLVFFFGRSSSGRSSSRTKHTFIKFSIPDSFFSCLRWTLIRHSSRKNVKSPAARKRYSGGSESRSSAVTFGFAVWPFAGGGAASSPSKSNSLPSLELSSSVRVRAWVMISPRSTLSESLSLHITNPGCRVVSIVFPSKSYTSISRSDVFARARFARLTMVSGMLALLNTSPNSNTLTVSLPAKQSLASCTTVSVSTPKFLDSHSWFRPSAMAFTETSLMSPKCSSQNRRESTCSSLLLVRVLNECNCVA